VTLLLSQTQANLFNAVRDELASIGYGGRLLSNYGFLDAFEPDAPERIAPAAAFAHMPPSYDSACHAVLLAGSTSGRALIRQFRALGAPFALEIHHDRVVPWLVGRDDAHTIEQPAFDRDGIRRAIRERSSSWSPDAVLRAKNIRLLPAEERQLDFIDVGMDIGLIREVERVVCERLDRLLRDVLGAASDEYRVETGVEPDTKQLFRLVFRSLAGKILHDRAVDGFKRLRPDQPDEILEKVATYYGEQDQPALRRRSVRSAVMSRMWSGLDFRNLSVDVLAYVYESTLVDPEVRANLGTHSTPHSIARYIVQRLPLDSLAQEDRRIVEPCSGHGIFQVAGLRRMRELLPADIDERERHKYFVRMLHGFERDPFAIEVNRLCLMLADFPNPNGWRLDEADVFRSKEFNAALSNAGVVLCNPPFEAFRADERSRYKDLRSVQKPVELLYRVLQSMSKHALLGFVLPRVFVDGAGYADVRKMLAKRFGRLDVVSLPDRVFRHSKLESALVLGSEPRSVGYETRVSFSRVDDRDRNAFLEKYRVTYRTVAMLPYHHAQKNLGLPPLPRLWEHLSQNPKLSDIADVHRGIEWQAPFDAGRYLSNFPKRGFVLGVHRAAEKPIAYRRPMTRHPYLSTRADDLRGGAIGYKWGQPKVVMNAVRAGRGPWRIAAFTDYTGRVYSQNFHGIWPRKGQSVSAIAAILNSPIANAFAWATEHQGKHIRVKTVMQVPVPHLNPSSISEIQRAASHYQKLSSAARRAIPLDKSVAAAVRRALLAVDAAVLRAYGLPPVLEVELLKAMSDTNARRPIVVQFKGYPKRALAAGLPLWLYQSLGRFHELVDHQLNGQLSPLEGEELARLERGFDLAEADSTPNEPEWLRAVVEERQLERHTLVAMRRELESLTGG
jgi:hypothetical protein